MHNPYAGKYRVTQTWDEHPDATKGVDYGMDIGTPIIAPCDGILHFFWNGSAGYDVVIFQADGSSERACHGMDNDLARSLHLIWVSEGQHVSYSGNTGNSTGPHVHCNGWRADSTRIPPFGQSTSSAGLDPTPFPTEVQPTYSGEENTMYWRHTNGLVASLDTTRGVYRYLYGWELLGLVEEEKLNRVVVHPLASPEWETMFSPLQLNGTVETTGGHVDVDDSDLDALAAKINAKSVTSAELVRQIITGVALADDAEHTALAGSIAALLAQASKLDAEQKKRIAALAAVLATP